VGALAGHRRALPRGAITDESCRAGTGAAARSHLEKLLVAAESFSRFPVTVEVGFFR